MPYRLSSIFPLTPIRDHRRAALSSNASDDANSQACTAIYPHTEVYTPRPPLTPSHPSASSLNALPNSSSPSSCTPTSFG